jgi:histone H3/H4
MSTSTIYADFMMQKSGLKLVSPVEEREFLQKKLGQGFRVSKGAAVAFAAAIEADTRRTISRERLVKILPLLLEQRGSKTVRPQSIWMAIKIQLIDNDTYFNEIARAMNRAVISYSS